MLPMSLSVTLTAAVLLGLTLLGFAWAWRRGLFDDLNAQSRVILDQRDYQLERPWETPEQRAERERRYGPLVEPEPGEWGGAE